MITVVVDLRIVKVDVGRTVVDVTVLIEVRVLSTVGVGRTRVEVLKMVLVVRASMVVPGNVCVVVLTVEKTMDVSIEVVPLRDVVLTDVPWRSTV